MGNDPAARGKGARKIRSLFAGVEAPAAASAAELGGLIKVGVAAFAVHGFIWRHGFFGLWPGAWRGAARLER